MTVVALLTLFAAMFFAGYVLGEKRFLFPRGKKRNEVHTNLAIPSDSTA